MVFKIDSLGEASISKKLKAGWLNMKEHQLQNGLVNVGAPKKLKLSAAKVLLEKKRKFQGDFKAVNSEYSRQVCRKVPIGLQIDSYYALLQTTQYGSPPCSIISTFQNACWSSFFALHKIKASVADKLKSQMEEFLQVAWFDQKEKFKNLDFCKDRLDLFFGDHLSKCHEQLWEVFKVVCTLSHGQSFTERGFSVNKEVIDHNMKEKSITSQRTVYDDIQQHSSNKVSDFPVSAETRKSWW